MRPRGISSPDHSRQLPRCSLPHGVKTRKCEIKARSANGTVFPKRDHRYGPLGSSLRPDRRRHRPACAAWESHEASKNLGEGGRAGGFLNAAFFFLSLSFFSLSRLSISGISRLGFVWGLVPWLRVGRSGGKVRLIWDGGRGNPLSLSMPGDYSLWPVRAAEVGWGGGDVALDGQSS